MKVPGERRIGELEAPDANTLLAGHNYLPRNLGTHTIPTRRLKLALHWQAGDESTSRQEMLFGTLSYLPDVAHLSLHSTPYPSIPSFRRALRDPVFPPTFMA